MPAKAAHSGAATRHGNRIRSCASWQWTLEFDRAGIAGVARVRLDEIQSGMKVLCEAAPTTWVASIIATEQSTPSEPATCPSHPGKSGHVPALPTLQPRFAAQWASRSTEPRRRPASRHGPVPPRRGLTGNRWPTCFGAPSGRVGDQADQARTDLCKCAHHGAEARCATQECGRSPASLSWQIAGSFRA